jgi:pyrroline-5-carboxylate reductase
MRVGFLGTGEIAAAMVRGLQGQGHSILVSPRNTIVAASLADELPEVRIAPNEEVVSGSDVVILCFPAPVARQVLPTLPFQSHQAILSPMVGTAIASLHQLCAPVRDISRIIAGPALAWGGCPLPVYPDSAALQELYGDRNLILPQVSEVALDAHLGASAFCSTILDELQPMVKWLASITGNRTEAESYISAMLGALLHDRLTGTAEPKTQDTWRGDPGMKLARLRPSDRTKAPK